MAVFSVSLSAQAAAPTKLYLFGGGPKPKIALSSFFKEADQGSKRVLFITWATAYPEETCEAFKSEAAEITTVSIECSPTASEVKSNPSAMLKKLSQASAIFFSGGDQSRIMNVFDSEPHLLRTLRSAFKSGVPVAGTSAGTAIQSDWMIEREVIPGSEEPEAVEVRTGVGLMRAGFVVDQHFLKRNRDKRLIAAMKKTSEPNGLGVDEGAAALILSSRHMLVFEGTARLYYRDHGGFKYIDRTPSDRVFDLDEVH